MPTTSTFEVRDLPVDVFALVDDAASFTSLTADDLGFGENTGRSCACACDGGGMKPM